MGAKVIPVDPNGVHSPYCVLVVVGVVFASAGLMVWGMAWKQYAANRRGKEVMQSGQGDAALADYPWDPRGFAAKRWARSVKALGMAGFMTLFLVTFNHWGLWTKSPWMVKAIVILFDLILLTVWWQTCLLLGRAVKFGGSSIEYAAFPFLLPKPIVIRWQSALGINQARKGFFTLRCVEEWFETHGSGTSRSTRMVHEQIWSGTWFLDRKHTFQPHESVELRFQPGSEAPSTNLQADRPVFWELEVKLDLPGLDFEEGYLVPVYRAGCTSGRREIDSFRPRRWVRFDLL